jgi:hypothetical protein
MPFAVNEKFEIGVHENPRCAFLIAAWACRWPPLGGSN